MRELPRHGAEPVRILEGLRADDHAFRAGRFENQADRRLVADAPADLAGNAGRFHDVADDLMVDRFAGPGAVQVDQVQARGPLGGPAPRDGHRVLGEDRFAVIVPLPQAHALTVAEINGRQDIHQQASSTKHGSFKHEARMTKEARSPKPQKDQLFGFRASCFLRHSCFVLSA